MRSCPVCSSRDTRVYIKHQGYVYQRCRACFLVFLSSDIREEDKVTYGREYIRRRKHDALGSYTAKAKKATADYYLSFLERYAGAGNLLEVGCSTGIALKAAKDRGWNAYGVDINPAAVSLAGQILGQEYVKAGPLSKDTFADDFFSAALLFDVLEHIQDPLDFIEILKAKLKKKGLLLIVTPDVDSFSAKLLKSKWPHFFLEHTRLYSPKSIIYLLDKQGFEILKIKRAVKFINIEIIRNHLKCHPEILSAKMLSAFLKYLTFLDKFIFPFNIGEMCVLARKR